MKPEIKSINKRISTYRKLAGYTQQTAAEALGIKKSTYARMELHGNPTPDMLVRLAKLYNVSVNLFLYGVDKSEKEEPKKPKPDVRLKDDIRIFAENPDIVLSTNEKNLVKVYRELPKKDKDEVLSFINSLYKNAKGNG
ncbi:MAG: helix-turn-helix domain-containing protein [Clostridia bacterium]|nr:helix-turn-helix domain-containing protein [Clostridia bacterium]